MRLAAVVALAFAVADPAAAGEDEGWRFVPARQEIAPRSWTEPDGEGGKCLGLAGKGDDAADGRWVREQAVSGGSSYEFRAEFRFRGVANPRRSVLARIVWIDGTGGGRRAMDYPALSTPLEDGWTALGGTYRAPEGVVAARLELHLRWTAHGEVRWRRVSLRDASPPGPRVVRLAAVNHRPASSPSAAQGRGAFEGLIEEAARRGADIVVLPEGITIVGSDRSYVEAAETVPGPTTEFLGALARRLDIWIVAGLYEREGVRVYNTAVLVGRDGSLAGRYRKMSLPDEEIEGGITPGGDSPVFDTDFGRVGMMICWDSSYPEVARSLAARGAEVILMPIWGGEETLVRARAIENQVYVVASGYDFRTGIFDRRGERIGDADRDPQVVLAEVDLNERTLWPWLRDWRSRIWREAPRWEEPVGE